MSETNGQATSTKLEPMPGYLLVQFSQRRKTKSGLELTYTRDLHSPKMRMGDVIQAYALAVGNEKSDMGSVIEPPCEPGATILFPAGCGYNATDFLKLERGADLDDDEVVIFLKFEDVLCTVCEE